MGDIRKYINLLESIEKDMLDEGVSFGQREYTETLINSDKFQMDIEYEMSLSAERSVP